MDSKDPRAAGESHERRHAEELIPVAPLGLEGPEGPEAYRADRSPHAEAAAALRELGGALSAIRDSVRSAGGAGREGVALAPAALPALERLADAVDSLSIDPDALTNALRGDSQPVSFEALALGFPDPPTVSPNDDGGWDASVGGFGVSFGGSGVSVDTPAGGASVDGKGARVDSPWGSASVSTDGASVSTPIGGARIDSSGKLTVTDASGKPVDVPVPGATGATGGLPFPTLTAVPFEIPIPVPTFVVQPLEIPIPVPNFKAEPLELKIPVPNFAVDPIELKLPVPSFAADPLRIPLPLPSFLSYPFELPPWMQWLKGFPDVQQTPTPAGPLPIPYPNVGLPWGFPSFGQLLAGPTGAASAIIANVSKAVVNALQQVSGIGELSTSLVGNVISAVAQAVTEVGQTVSGGLAGFPLPDPPPWLEAPAAWVPEVGRAVARTVSIWVLGSTLQEGLIMGMNCIVAPGSLGSSVDFRSTLATQLSVEGVPAEFADPVARVLAEAWDGWFAGCVGTLQYPLFAAFPGPQAPPTPNVPQPLISLPSPPGVAALTPAALEEALRAELDGAADAGDLEPSVRQLAWWFSERFLAWTASTHLVNVLGTGPVPSFAPPLSPVGPVMGGTVIPTPGILVGGNTFGEFAPWNTP